MDAAEKRLGLESGQSVGIGNDVWEGVGAIRPGESICVQLGQAAAIAMNQLFKLTLK